MPEFHELANVFPMLNGSELEALAADIATNGQRHPITLYQGKILDGRNRYAACELAGVDPRFTEYTGTNPVAFVVSENIARRHLDESQRAMCAAKLAMIKNGGDRRSTNFSASIDALITQPKAAAMLNVSRPSVQRAAQVIDRGVPELVQAVERGEIAVSRAAQIAKEPQEKQREEIKKPHVSHNSGNNEWYTPPEFIEAAREVLGSIDLDPASSEFANQTVRAKKFYTIDDNGLDQKWRGRVWMNPPYAAGLVDQFADKLRESVEGGQVTRAIILVNNATETGWFRTIAGISAAVCFPQTRIRFLSPDGELGSPLQGQAFLYIGDDAKLFKRVFEKFGLVWRK